MKWKIKREGRGEKLVERESDLEERRRKWSCGVGKKRFVLFLKKCCYTFVCEIDSIEVPFHQLIANSYTQFGMGLKQQSILKKY